MGNKLSANQSIKEDNFEVPSRGIRRTSTMKENRKKKEFALDKDGIPKNSQLYNQETASPRFGEETRR